LQYNRGLIVKAKKTNQNQTLKLVVYCKTQKKQKARIPDYLKIKFRPTIPAHFAPISLLLGANFAQ